MPAALKWLVLGTIAWLLWRVPIVARDFLRLQQQATSALPLPGQAPAQGELPLPITEENQAADSITIAAKSAYASILPRSEEHTSELQSLMRISYAVFCLKKKNQESPQPTNIFS